MKIINILICLFFAFSNAYAVTDDDKVHMLPTPEDVGIFTVTSVDGRVVTSNELIVASDGVFAIGLETHSGVRVKSATTPFTIIVPSKGTIVQYSYKFKKWFPCSVINGVYNADNFDQDTINYHLNPNNPF